MHHTNDRICHHPSNKAWMKITGPAAGPFGGVFFGSTALIKPEVMVAGQSEKEVKAQKKDMANSSKEHSVNVGVYTTLVTAPQGAEGMKPQKSKKHLVLVKGYIQHS